MKTDTIQTSFVGGELAPALFGRTDIAQYSNACELIENFLIRPYGSLISTPGTEFINDCKNSGPTSNTGIDDDTLLLMHFEGDDGSNTFIDSSPYNRTVSESTTNVEIDTAQAKFGLSSALFSGGSAALTTQIASFPHTSSTIECRVRFNSVVNNSFYYILLHGSVGDSVTSFSFYVQTLTSGTGMLGAWLRQSSGIQLTSSVLSIGINTWYHTTLVKSGSNIKLFWDGVVVCDQNVASNTIPTLPMNNGTDFGIGTGFGIGSGGYLDELRVSAVPRWTTSFTPPTVAYSNASEFRARLIQFIFSRTDAYIIEMGVGYFRFYTNGAVVVSSGTTPYEVLNAYEEDEIYDVQYAQLNDVIYLAHPNHPPRTLTRIASNNWVLANFPFTGGPYLSDGALYAGSTTATLTNTTISVSGTAGSVTVSSATNLFVTSGSALGHVNTFWKIGSTVTDSTTGLAVQGYVKLTAITNPSTATGTIIQPLSTTSSTEWAQGAWSDVLGWPARVTFHQQRLCFARTNVQPQNVWCSQSFAYENFAINGGADDDAIDIQLASTESNEIKWLVSGDALIAGTYGGEFVIRTGDDSPLTPASTNVAKQTSWGSEAIPPKRIGNFFYYVQRFSRKLRELFFIWDLNSYKSIDKTILSPHISGGGFVDLTYQQNPDTILWAVCSDGTLATMTREVDQEIQGWSRQITNGDFESIAAIPSRTEPHDEVWVVVRRTIEGVDRRFIERFKSQIIPDRQDACFYVHSGLSYNAFDETASATATTISLSATSGTIVITSSAAYFSADDIGQRIRAIDSDGNRIGEVRITARTSSTVVVGEVTSVFDATSYAAGDWGVSVSALSGYDHLEGKDVVILADGGTDKPAKTVSSGTITLTNDAFVVVAGLGYTQKIKTLPQEAGAQRGTAQGKKQRINEVGFKVYRSYTGFNYGGTDETLSKLKFRDPNVLMGTAPTLYTGTIPNIYFRDEYQYGSKVIIENSDPLPIELLSLITTIDTQEKT